MRLHWSGGVLTTKSSSCRSAGRLHQVEYAIEAINNAGTCVGIMGKEGIVLAGEQAENGGRGDRDMLRHTG